MSLSENIYQTILRYDLLPPDATLIVAVSGGADSLALLHILNQLRHRARWQLHAATLDHGLRGQAGADDAAFVVQTCNAWGIPVTVGRADVPLLARQRGTGIEETARAARYDFLAATARANHARHIVTAHHADDQAETILLHLIRGSGLQGLTGMNFRLPLPAHPDLTLIRPLLNITRREIEAYCAAHDLRSRHDSTNLDTAYLRNRIRLQTLPDLRQLNPQVDRALLQLADIAAVESDYISQQLAELVMPHARLEAGRVALDRGIFRQLHPALQRRFVRHAAQTLGAADAGYEHITQAAALATRGEAGAQALLPGGLRLRVDYSAVVVERADAPPPPYNYPLLPRNSVISATTPGHTPLPGGTWTLHTSDTPVPAAQPLAIPSGADLALRTRRAGDQFAPLGLGGHHQSLRKWLINRKIPQALRAQLPLLTVNGQIAALFYAGQWFISEDFALQQDSPRVLYFLFTQPAANN